MNADPNLAKSIFLEAVEKHAPDQWPAFLDQACAEQPDLRGRVEALLEAHLEAGTAAHRVAAVGPPPFDVGGGAIEQPGSVIGPYKLLQQIGEGGMGIVFMAEQTHLVQRKVALKLIKSGMDSRQVIARFEAERQALALMDHPHIAKVLDAGTTSGESGGVSPGRPYFVMELVKGMPITKYCDEHRLTPRERLELFVPVCQAVQHAHQKGIIHRDLKPSNVMVCLYDGKPVPKVIDFGVAKATGQKLTERTLFTEFGAVVGTLEYMSPEQAEVNQLDTDTRSDIYALGVLLYELLTGTTPLERKRLKEVALLEVLRLIREEEAPRPSTRLSTAEGLPSIAANRGLEPKQLSSLVHGELDWIVMKALEKDRERRYETANGFAQDIQRYLHNEPVQACPPSAAYRLRKFARRHPTALGITAAVLLALLLTAGSIAWALWDRAAQGAARAQQRTETENTVREALGRTEELGRQARGMPLGTSREAGAAVVVWQRAADALAPATAALRIGEADAGLRRRVRDLSEQLHKGRDQAKQRRGQAERREKLLRDLDDAHMASATWIETHFDYAGAATKYAQAFAAYGIDVRPGQAAALAQRLAAEEPVVRDALIVALDLWTYCAVNVPTEWSAADLQWVARAVDADVWRKEYRRAVMNRDGVALGRLSKAARTLSLPPTSLELLANGLRRAGQRGEAVELLRWARGRHPTDFWISFWLGNHLNKGEEAVLVDREERIGCYRVALALRPNASAAHVNLGKALKEKGQLDEAITAYRKAIGLDPKHVVAHNNLGIALSAKGQVDAAIAEYRTAIELEPKYALAHNNLGNALRAKGQLHAAITAYRTAIDLDPRFAYPHSGLGNALVDKGQLDEAVAAYRTAIDLDLKYASAHNGLGNALRERGQLDEAVAAFRQAIDLDPKLAPAHNGLGNALRNKGQLDAAITAYRTAIDLDPKLAPFHSNLGLALVDKGQVDMAIAAFRHAIALDPRYANAHAGLGNALRVKGHLNEAIAAYRTAIALDPKDAWAHSGLGNALKVKGQLDEAIAESRRAIALAPKCAPAHYNLGNALAAKNRLDEAIAAYRKAIAMQPSYAEAHCNLGNVLGRQGHFAESLACFRRGHELGSRRPNWRYPSAEWVRQAERMAAAEQNLPGLQKGDYQPRDNDDRLILAQVCHVKQWNRAAARLYADAFDTDPKLADDLKTAHRYNAACDAALAAAGQGTDAGKLDGNDRARLRKQALTWLRADLAAWDKRLAAQPKQARAAVLQTMEHWQRDPDFAGVRGPEALAKLPEAERQDWEQLWQEIEALRRKTGESSHE
jgi:tetratricopeptide (TPR) repeat protein/serine/threonine protein kinase